jgi:succinoglycan biosynthesis transport protein ExoP
MISSAGQSVLITSSLPAEGKTTTALSLAQVLRATGSSVIVVDADLRRPRIARALGMDGALGLPEVLIGRSTLDEAIQSCAGAFDVLPTATIVPNPSELLGSEPMKAVVEELRQRYDFVVYDSAPALAVTDSIVLSREVDATLLVTAPSMVRRAALEAMLEAFHHADVEPVGVVATKVQLRERRTYQYVTAEERVAAKRPSIAG